MAFVRDFYRAVDVSAGTWVEVDLGGMTDGQALLNESTEACEVSFDSAHAVVYPLKTAGATSQLIFDDHQRAKLWARRASGTGGTITVQVFAWSQP